MAINVNLVRDRKAAKAAEAYDHKEREAFRMDARALINKHRIDLRYHDMLEEGVFNPDFLQEVWYNG